MAVNVEKFKKTKMKNHIKSLDVGNFEEEDCEFKISKSRVKNRLSLDEYILILKEKSWSQNDFKDNGYSRHQVSFYNWILKGKNPIDKEIFIEEYCHSMMELFDIAKKYNIPKDNMSFLREYYGVKREGHKRRLRIKNEEPLSEHQEQIILGSLLGDGFLDKSGSFRLRHSVKQIEYARWVLKKLSNHSTYEDVKVSDDYDERHDSFNKTCFFSTLSHSGIREIIKYTYLDGERKVSIEWLNKINDLGLAIWFMDDGTTDFSHRNTWDSLPVCKIFTCSFSYAENKIIQGWFKDKYGINPSIKYKKVNKNPYLYFNCDDSLKLISIINPFVIDSMRYKVDFEVNLEQYIESKKNRELISNIPTKSNFLILKEKCRSDNVDLVYDFYRKEGFPKYSFSDDELLVMIEKLKNLKSHSLSPLNDKNIKQNTRCSNMIQFFMPHMFNLACKGSLSPTEIFNNDEMFKDAILRRLSYGGKCTHSGIKSVLKTYKNNRSVSNFMPSVAKYIYDNLLKEDSTVLDFCAGFGGRMLGAISSKNVKIYECIDPLKENTDGLEKMNNKVNNGDTEVVIHNSTAESIIYNLDKKYDMVFTSPPYFDKEIYSDEKSQSYNLFNTYDKWLNMWLVPMVIQSSELLNDGGIIVLSLGNTHSGRDVTTDLEYKLKDKLEVIDTYYMETGAIEYNRKNKTKRSFPIKVYKKVI